jgi:hypothetical protein
MSCKSCGSVNQTKVAAEINLHLSIPESLSQPSILVFPKVLVCLDCGISQFILPESELGQLRGSIAA